MLLSAFDKQKSRLSFDRAAHRYDQYAGLQRQVAETLLNHLDTTCNEIQARSILDLGCGTGQVTEAMCLRYPDADVVALDFSKEMLSQTDKRLSQQGYTSLGICADAEQLPFERGSFDLVISSLMLQWSNDLQQTLANIRDSLTAEGMLAFTSFSEGTLKEIKTSWGIVDGAAHSSDFLPLGTMHAIADAAGFSKVIIVPETIVMHYDSVREMLLEIKGIGASNARAERNRGLTGKHRFKEFERAFELQRTAEGDFPCTWEVTYVFCAK